MVFNIFLDANVILDLTLKRGDLPKTESLFELIVQGKVKAFVTPSIMHSVGSWLSKSIGNKATKIVLLTLLKDIKIIEMDHEMALLALHSEIDDIEDALQYYAALHHNLDFFISGDKEFQKSSRPTLPVISAADFLKQITPPPAR